MKIFFSIVVIIILFGSVSYASAHHISYTDKIAYAVESEKIIAHMIAMYDNFGKDGVYEELNRMHFSHIIEHDIKHLDKYYVDHKDFKNKLGFTLFVAQNSKTEDKPTFVNNAREVLTLLNTGSYLITDGLDDDKFFRLSVTTSLLEHSKQHYDEANEVTGIESLLKNQHGDTIAIRAHMYLDNTLGVPDKIKESVEPKFQKIFKLNKDVYAGKFEQYELIDEIIWEIYTYINEEQPKFTNYSPHNTELIDREIILQIDKIDNNNIVSFVGEGFPKDAVIEIKYTTNTESEIYNLKVHSLEDGTFFLPVEMNTEEKTYFVSAECQERITSHIISSDV